MSQILMSQFLNTPRSSQMKSTQPKFGAIIVNRDSIANSGLGSVAAENIQGLADQLNRAKDRTTPVLAMEDAGIDIVISGSADPSVSQSEDGERVEGNVNVVFMKRGQYEPLLAISIGSFENRYDSQDAYGRRFLAKIYEQSASVTALLLQRTNIKLEETFADLTRLQRQRRADSSDSGY